MMHKTGESKEEKIYLVKQDADAQKLQREAMEKTIAMTGKTAPLFELTDINGKRYTLNDLKGKVVVLNF